MARRSRSQAIVRAFPVMKAPAPIIRVSAPRAPAKKKHHRRASQHGGLNGKTMLGAGLGGAGLGLIEKMFPTLPTVPLIGRAGTIAIASYFLAKRGAGGGILRDVALAAAAVAGYQLGATGKIAGDVMGDVMGDVSPQVSGIAAQV